MNFTEWLVTNLPTILCLVIGLGLVITEMFLPGFGFFGLSGIALLAGAVIFTWINYGALVGSLMMIGVLILAVVCLLLSLRSASKGKLSKSSVFLKTDETDGEPVRTEAAVAAGDTGVTQTPLRPAGIALINGAKVSVVSEGQFIGQGVPVRVIDTQGTRIVVSAEEVQPG